MSDPASGPQNIAHPLLADVIVQEYVLVLLRTRSTSSWWSEEGDAALSSSVSVLPSKELRLTGEAFTPSMDATAQAGEGRAILFGSREEQWLSLAVVAGRTRETGSWRDSMFTAAQTSAALAKRSFCRRKGGRHNYQNPFPLDFGPPSALSAQLLVSVARDS